jgi:ABC-2 type transport system permease protein
MITQAAFELRLLMRNGEQLLLTLIIPVALLLGVTLVPAIPLSAPPGAERVPEALGGVLAVAIIASAFTSLAISVGFDRRSGALLMLATTPLSRNGILGARALATMGMVAIQMILLVITAMALGWRPGTTAIALPLVALLGTAAFAALGFALGGAVRAEATLAFANAIFLGHAPGATLAQLTNAANFGLAEANGGLPGAVPGAGAAGLRETPADPYYSHKSASGKPVSNILSL